MARLYVGWDGTLRQPVGWDGTLRQPEIRVQYWDPKEAALDRDTARSQHGYIIKYAGSPLLWKSQLQTEIAMSTTESEYTGLSYALRDAIPVMELLKEMKSYGYPIMT
jgi:hypothetical protein